MQILCGLQVVFFLFNCQTPEAGNHGYGEKRQKKGTKAENGRIHNWHMVKMHKVGSVIAGFC